MAEKQMWWTQQQLRAIKARSSDVFVTASAGTGKTSVLSGRFVDMLRDKSLRPDVQNILVLTFTEAAAEQMRSRIARQLRETLSEKDDQYLRRQLMLLQGADISTIHSFCKRLITEYFYKLSLDPTFRVIDEDEQRLLKAEVLEKTIDWAWQQSNLTDVLGELLYRRDLRTVEGFAGKVIKISDFLDGVVWRQGWYEQAIKISEVLEPVSSGLGEKQKQIIKDKIADILQQLEHCQKIYRKQYSGGDWDKMCDARYIEAVRSYRELLESGDWDTFVKCIRDYKKPKVYKPKDVPEIISKLIHKIVKKAVDSLDALKELAVINPEYVEEVHGAANRQTKVLVELVKRFDRLYGQRKRELNCLDFADLEHYALRLLADEDSSLEELVPSQTALGLRRRYKFIFVDEYQDINLVQEAILKLLGSKDNIFVVGDVKQSIYAWRGAAPEIFLNHLASASLEQARAETGFRVDLNANFRSAKSILDFVNKVFERIMTCSFGSFDYDDSARLRPGLEELQQASPSEDAKPAVEIHVIDRQDRDSQQQEESGDRKGRIYRSRQYEAAMIARRIREMVGADTGQAEFRIFDKNEKQRRDVKYRDIVILMRSVAKKKDFPEVLRMAGVPVSCAGIAGYFEATETRDVLSVLKVLDNPLRDIELSAVLRSPLFEISDSELARIKIFGKGGAQGGNFYQNVRGYMEDGPDDELAGKLRKAMERLERWRGLARQGNLADLIWQIYRETGLIPFVRALANGRARKANLLKLHDRAIQFEAFVSSAGIPSLTRFVEFIEKLQEAGEDWSGGEVECSAQNAVRILSIHKSKGLEFPVVFLSDLDSRFNMRDITDECLTDAQDTLGLQVVKPETNIKLSSLAHQVISERTRNRSLSEEMRIFYVATTRAQQRLVLTASKGAKQCQRILSDGLLSGGQRISFWQLDSCRSPFEWVLYALSDQKNIHQSFETGLDDKGSTVRHPFQDDEGLFNVRVYGSGGLRDLSNYINELKNKFRQKHEGKSKTKKMQRDNKLLRDIKESINRRYPFSEACGLPAKRSVTQLTHQTDEYIKLDYSRALERQPIALIKKGQHRQASLTGGQWNVQSRIIGTATHLVISKLDLSSPVTLKTIKQTKEKLLSSGAINKAAGEAIDTESILGFFHSEPAERILCDAYNIQQEWGFTFSLPLSEWREIEGIGYSGDEDEDIVVQGIIDLLAQTPKGLIIVDFKTDDISEQELYERAEAYRAGLELYGLAASAILGEKTVGEWLYFLKPGRWFQIK